MAINSRKTAIAIVCCLLGLPFLMMSCQSGGQPVDDSANVGDVVVLSQEQMELARLEEELRQANALLESRDAAALAQQEAVAALEQSLADLRNDLNSAIVSRDTELTSLRTEREALLLDLERLSLAAEVAAAQAESAQTAAEAAVASARTGIASVRTDADNANDAALNNGVIHGALSEALGGLGGFRRVESLGFESDSRMGSRLAVAGSGLAVDSTGNEPVLFDTGLAFDSSLIYLTIVDPAGDEPRLMLTVQYVSDVRPVYAETAFITIEGNDPIDPVDPVIFAGGANRETDGVRIREAFTREVDQSLLNRISTMLTSSSFASTFVGTVGKESHRPTLSERAALSRVLFAYIDLGGYR